MFAPSAAELPFSNLSRRAQLSPAPRKGVGMQDTAARSSFLLVTVVALAPKREHKF